MIVWEIMSFQISEDGLSSTKLRDMGPTGAAQKVAGAHVEFLRNWRFPSLKNPHKIASGVVSLEC